MTWFLNVEIQLLITKPAISIFNTKKSVENPGPWFPNSKILAWHVTWHIARTLFSRQHDTSGFRPVEIVRNKSGKIILELSSVISAEELLM